MKIAIVGTSKIAQTMTNAILKSNTFEIVAVYSRTRENAENISSIINGIKVYTNYNLMLKDSKINVIYIATPNVLHYNQVKTALEMKKSVICEKPSVLHSEEWVTLCNIAKNNDIYLFEAITTPYLPNYQRLIQLVDKKDIRMIRCDSSQYSKKYHEFKAGKQNNRFDKNMGGGALYDMGVYPIHFVYGILGLPNSYRVYARMLNGVDTSGSIILKYNNATVSITFGKDSVGYAGALVQTETSLYQITGPVSRCIKLVETNLNGVKIDHTLSTDTLHYIYELNFFFDIIKNKKKDLQELCWKQSLDVCKIVEELMNHIHEQ